jgi:hypothetical protein
MVKSLQRKPAPSKRGTLTKEKKKDMSTAKAHIEPPKTKAQQKLQVVENKIVPIKIGIFGGEGSGKTTTAALIALALSILYHNKAPVFVTDTEPGWQFLKRIFKVEGVELIQRTTPTFAALIANLEEAERLGACVFGVDQLTVIWEELMESFKKKNRGQIPINKWGDLKKAMWRDMWTTPFMNSPLHGLSLGRVGNVMDELLDEQKDDGSTKLLKTGEQFKAGGSQSFGYEPHLLLQMSLERKPKVKSGSKLEGQGRFNHRVDVLKDRTWALNGGVFRFSDKPSYEKGGYMTVWRALKPHFDLTQETKGETIITEGADSTALITDSGSSEWYERQQRRDALAREVHASVELLFGGATQNAKRMRLLVFEHVFGFRDKENADKASLETIERALRIFQSFENLTREESTVLSGDEAAILHALDSVIAAFDDGENFESVDDIPF